jgi:hypothetical protein
VAEPMPVLDVLRAAVSEIEHYQRVVVQNPPDATFDGSAANDIQHLLAELLDNATNFSPGDSQVVMSCSQARDDSILVEIFDEGIGLSPGEVITLNERLRNPVESTASVAASRRMGLFVVGRLANRHGISVGLFTDSLGASAAAAKRGVTARVTIPAELVGERVDEPDQVVWSRIDPAPAVPARIVLPPGPAPRTPAVSAGSEALAAGSDGAALPSDDHARQAPRPRYDPTSGETTMRLPVVSAEPEPDGAPEPAHAPPPVDPGEDVRLEPPNLFEPIVPPPSLPDPAEPRPPDPLASEVEEFEATPIFAEVTSGWFHVPAPRSHDAEPVPVGVGARSRQDPSAFVTSADAVWQAARAATESQPAGYTPAGLPKRVPRGRLMPGSAMPGEPPPSISGRDPDAVRGRLSTFQRGVRHGRHMRADEDSTSN